MTNHDLTYRLGIDLGGTKIEGVALGSDGEIHYRHRVSTPSGDYEGTLAAIITVVEAVEKAIGTGPLPIGIGTPGAISLQTGELMNCNSTCLNGHNLPQDLEALSGRPVRIANDADCFALSEASDGAGKDYDTVFGVILGTGVGGGIVIRQQLLQGVNAICGEWGHNSLPLANYQPNNDEPPAIFASSEFSKRQCFCGRFNCVETWLAGPGFQRSWQELTGNQLPAQEIVDLARSGNQQAHDLLSQYSNLLALGLSSVINLLDPAIITLGGGMSNIDELYELLPEYLPRYVFSDVLNTKIVKAQHGDSGGVRGAAWLWPEK